MNIQEEREYILAENNTAQERLIDILDTISPVGINHISIVFQDKSNIWFVILLNDGSELIIVKFLDIYTNGEFKQ